MTTYDEYGVPVGAYSEPESLTHQAWRLVRAFFLYRIRPAVQEKRNELQSGSWSFKRLFTLVRALVLLWWLLPSRPVIRRRLDIIGFASIGWKDSVANVESCCCGG